MNTTYLMIATVVLSVIFIGAGLGLIFARQKRLKQKQLQEQFGTEYNLAVSTLGDEKKAEKELEERRKRIESLNIHPLTIDQRARYQNDWIALQAKFVDEPDQAVIAADRLIMEVMQLRSYPVANFEERVADLSVNYPALVSNYRTARKITLKNEQGQAETEELRLALLCYRSLFERLLEAEPVLEREDAIY